MKNHSTSLLSLLCILFLSGCGSSNGNTLMAKASPETSALTFYTCDGTSTTWGFLFEEEEINKFLRSISSVNARPIADWSPEQITFPVYGLEIGDTDGYTIQAAWSNGCWIAQDGAAYRFDCDFQALADDYIWTSEDSSKAFSMLPCSRLLCQHEDKWYHTLLSPAKEPIPPEHITVSLVSQSDDTLTVDFTNHGTDEWGYGDAFYLHVLQDGIWYDVPALPGEWAFNDILNILPAGTSQENTYNLSMYGSLPHGEYRLSVEGATVEFTIK